LGSAWFKQGVIAFQQDNLGKARAAFIQSQGTSNFLPSSLCYLAMIDARKGDFDSAQLKLADACKLSPPNDLLLTALREVAFNLSQREDLSQALRFYQEATSRHSNDFPSWLGLGSVYHRLGYLAEARHAYLQASQLEANHPGPWHNLGLLAAEESNFGEACEYFEKEAKLTPNNPKAWYDLGVSLQSMGNQEASQTAFVKAEDLLTDPIGVTGDLLTGMRIVRRTQLKKKVFKVK
jgi:Flp pilus assembly protein TadD